MDILNIADLKAHLSKIVAEMIQTGEPVIIGKYGKPVAKLIPFSDYSHTREIGFAKHLSFADEIDVQKQVDEPTDAETLAGFYS